MRHPDLEVLMRLPVRSEAAAFRFTFAFAALTLGSIVLGALTEPVAGLALYAIGITGAVAFELFTRDPDRRKPLYEAAHEPHQNDRGTWRVLVVADEVPAGHELRDLIMSHAKGTPEIDAVCPVLTSRTRFMTTDIDLATGQARERLNGTLAWAREEGIEAHGAVGDPIDPFVEIESQLRRYGADEVIVAVRPAGESQWLEHKIVDRMRSELDVPVTCVTVGAGERVEPRA